MSLSELLRRALPLSWFRSDRKAMDILAAFVCDAEHEMKSVTTALQANIELLAYEQTKNRVSPERFKVLNRAVARLISDTNILASVTELTMTPRVMTKFKLNGLIEEITNETKLSFSAQGVLVATNIAAETTLSGSADALKLMLKETVLTLLQECKRLETMSITGKTERKGISLVFQAGDNGNHGKFVDWQLGKLRLNPSNGEGISLAAVDAIARVHYGQLSVKTLENERHQYRLLFNT